VRGLRVAVGAVVVALVVMGAGCEVGAPLPDPTVSPSGSATDPTGTVTSTGEPSPDPSPEPSGPFDPATLGITNTGWVGAGLGEDRLTPHHGSLTTTADGQVIDSIHVIGGGITVEHDNVTITRSRVSRPPLAAGAEPTSKVILVRDGVTGLRVEWTELDGSGSAGSCIGGPTGNSYRWTLYRVDVHGCVDGIKVGSGSTVVESWVHDLARAGTDPHIDAVQVSGGSSPRSGITLTGNRFDVYTPSSGDFGNAVLMIGSFSAGGGLSGFTYTNNYGCGGNFSVQDNAGSAQVFTGITFAGNQWCTDTRYPEGAEPQDRRRIYSGLDNRLTVGIDWPTETWAETGAPL